MGNRNFWKMSDIAPPMSHPHDRSPRDLFGDDDKGPDYGAITASNERLTNRGLDAADKDAAFRERVYNENKPFIEEGQHTGLRAAEAQIAAMDDANSRADQQWDRYTNTFIPVEDKMVSEAMAYGGNADQDMQAGRAVADSREQAAINDAMTSRSLASMGVNPNSGRFASSMRRNTLMSSAGAAGSATNARVAARDKGIGLRAGAASFGRNMTNTAGQMTGIGINAGTAATGSAGAAGNAVLPSAQFATGGTGNQINAAQTGIQSNLGLAGLQSADYRTGTSDNPMGGLVGAAANLGSAWLLRR